MWIVGEARGLYDLQIERRKVVDLRKSCSILGDCCRAVGIDDNYGFASSVKARRVQLFQFIGSLYLVGGISLRREVAQRGVSDVRSITIASIGGCVGGISKSMGFRRAKSVTLEK